MIAGVAVVAFVVAFLALRGGGSDNAPTASAGNTSSALSTTGECGDGKLDTSYTVAVTSDPNPPRPDGTTFHIAVRHNGTPVTGAKVCLAADMPDMQHPGVNRTAKETGNGNYDADLKFGMGGSWSASVTILEPGKDSVLLTMIFQVTE
jgi:hypothetical protein